MQGASPGQNRFGSTLLFVFIIVDHSGKVRIPSRHLIFYHVLDLFLGFFGENARMVYPSLAAPAVFRRRAILFSIGRIYIDIVELHIVRYFFDIDCTLTGYNCGGHGEPRHLPLYLFIIENIHRGVKDGLEYLIADYPLRSDCLTMFFQEAPGI